MTTTAGEWVVSNRATIALDRPRILAVINVTPDSFSDGGDHATPEDACCAAERAVAEGADALDLGGESTRPGAASVDAAEQVRRVIPALRLIRRRVGDAVPITIDTTLSSVAAAALSEGADAVNDVSGGRDDAAMLSLAASRGAGVILMHRLVNPSRDSYSDRYTTPPDYGAAGVVACVRAFLAERARAALDAGVPAARIVLDPGLGFGKTVEQNLELIERTQEIAVLGFPVLSGISRKSFTARAAGMAADAPPRDRLAATLGLSVAHLMHGARIFRVHDVAAHVQALRAAWGVTANSRVQIPE